MADHVKLKVPPATTEEGESETVASYHRGKSFSF